MPNLPSDASPLPGKPLGRRERKKLDTRRRIFRAAFELFTAKGFESTTVEEIAERADVGKGTVFNYFPQKTAFLVAAYQEWVELMQEELGPLDSWEGSARSQLSRVLGYLTDKAVQRRALARLVIFENMRQAHLRMTLEEPGPSGELTGGLTGPNALEGESDAVRALELMAREVIRKGKERAEIRPDVDEGQAASLIAAAGFHTLVRGLIRGSSSRDINAAMGRKLDIIFSGLSL
ncbi:MAG: TetR/AcrR family transcriptional regulator [Longimicrobiales bacterium]